MRLLLDTHIFLWAVSGNKKLSPAARKLILGAEQNFVSAASIWEIAFKSRLRKINADPEQLIEAVIASGFFELPISLRHASAVAQLPMHTQDPFDRLLLAQALGEPLILLTADKALAPYGNFVKLV